MRIKTSRKSLSTQKIVLPSQHQQPCQHRRDVEKGFELEGTIRNDYKTTSGEVVDLNYYWID